MTVYEMQDLVDKAVEKGDSEALLEMVRDGDTLLSILASSGMMRLVAEQSLQAHIKAGRITEEEAEVIRSAGR